MIVADTSALIAMALGEPAAEACISAIEAEAEILVSAGTVTEALIVATGRNVVDELLDVLDRAGCTVVPVTETAARRIGSIYARWGEGFHPAGLNFGDCFAYELATRRDCPLLFVGDDFAQTDVKRAL